MRSRAIGTVGVLILMTAGCAQPAVTRPVQAVAWLGSPQAPDTSRASLDATIQAAETRLKSAPADAAAAIRLADALMRQARVTGNPGLAIRAERALRTVLSKDVERYDARRMLATVLLSEHRFREAIGEAERCRQMHPADAWTHGVIGDAHLELGEYDAAFVAFGRMDALRPDAASYARLAYAHELQGDLAGAMHAMTMALEATSPGDPESQAWHHAQLGHLWLAQNHLADAAREFDHANYIFPDHPFAVEGLARVASRQGHHAEALALIGRLLATTPAPSVLAFSAEELRALGRTDDATRQDALAEAAWRTDAPEPARLALFLADRPARTGEAVQLAEAASRDRDDIFTNDALAWAYFRAGRLSEAVTASARALRTGSADPVLRRHATAIASAVASAVTKAGSR